MTTSGQTKPVTRRPRQMEFPGFKGTKRHRPYNVPAGKTILAYLPEFRKFAKTHAREFRVLRLGINANFEELKKLREGETIDAGGIRVTREGTGSYKGNHLGLSLRAEVGGKSLFVRITPNVEEKTAAVMQSFRGIEKTLRKLKNRVGGFTFHIIKPHLIYFDASRNAVVRVCDFYGAKEVIQAVDIRNATLKQKVENALAELAHQVAIRTYPKKYIYDLTKENAFYVIGKTSPFFRSGEQVVLIFDPRAVSPIPDSMRLAAKMALRKPTSSTLA